MVSKKEEEFAKKWAKVVAKAWSDPAFKEKLMKNPQQILKEYDIAVPAGKRIVIQEESNDTLQLFLPKKPAASMSQEELLKVAAASQGWCQAACS